jgi:hypothetical protein
MPTPPLPPCPHTRGGRRRRPLSTCTSTSPRRTPPKMPMRHDCPRPWSRNRCRRSCGKRRRPSRRRERRRPGQQDNLDLPRLP